MDSLDHGLWRCRYLCGRTKVRVFRSLVLPVLLYGCETWTLTKDLRRRLNSFGTRSLRRILGYHWSDFVSNERLLRETRMRFVTCIVRERQLRLYGHVRLLTQDNFIEDVRRKRYYEKPCRRCQRQSFEMCKRIYDSEMSRRIKFLSQKNRTDPWVGYEQERLRRVVCFTC
uniref:Uncharacterized protein n=1 Tax=Eptatretus burgeri TaxID=7764 RepID=A0A8C4Q8Q3_EPTBU